MNFNDDETKSRKKGCEPLGCLLGLLVIFGVVYIVYIFMTTFDEGWDALEAPWAHPLFGRPTLTGGWTGEFAGTNGIQFALHLDIERAKLPDGSYYTEDNVGAIIAGQAQWCDNSGRHAESNPIDGSVPAFSGFNGGADRVKIFLEHPIHPQDGLLPNEFEGNWHNDRLTLNPASFLNWDGNNFVASGGDLTDSSTFTMRKGDQSTFRALCQKLMGSNP